MTEEKARQLAAVSLGISVEGMEWLAGNIAPFRHADEINIDSPIRVYADQDGADMWEVEITGNMTVQAGADVLVAQFRVRNFIANREFWRGSCQVPDYYKITANGQVLFEGEVENPDDPQDDPGWERYQLFNPIRLEAWDTATAMLYTDRIERQVIEPDLWARGSGARVCSGPARVLMVLSWQKRGAAYGDSAEEAVADTGREL